MSAGIAKDKNGEGALFKELRPEDFLKWKKNINQYDQTTVHPKENKTETQVFDSFLCLNSSFSFL